MHVHTLYIYSMQLFSVFFSSYSVRQQKVERIKLHAPNWVGSWSRERGYWERACSDLKFMAPISDVE